jgi:hypothetical protein
MSDWFQRGSDGSGPSEQLAFSKSGHIGGLGGNHIDVAQRLPTRVKNAIGQQGDHAQATKRRGQAELRDAAGSRPRHAKQQTRMSNCRHKAVHSLPVGPINTSDPAIAHPVAGKAQRHFGQFL